MEMPFNYCLHCNVTQLSYLQAVDAWGTVDVLINNAG